MASGRGIPPPPTFDDGRASVDEDDDDDDDDDDDVGHVDATIASDTASYSSGLEHRSSSSRRSRTHVANDFSDKYGPAVVIRGRVHANPSSLSLQQRPSSSLPHLSSHCSSCDQLRDVWDAG